MLERRCGWSPLRFKDALVRHAEVVRQQRRARLRIASFGPTATAARRLLPPLLDRFAARHPHVDLVVVEGPDDDAARWLRDGTTGVAFVPLPNSAFDTVLVAEDALQAVLPVEDPLARLPRVAPSQLDDDPFILTTGGCERLVREAAGPTSLDVRYQFREIGTLVEMVGRGMGIAVTPQLALPAAPREGIAFVPLDAPFVRHVGLALRRPEGAGSLATPPSNSRGSNLPPCAVRALRPRRCSPRCRSPAPRPWSGAAAWA